MYYCYICRTWRRSLLRRPRIQRSGRAAFTSLSAQEPPKVGSLTHNGQSTARDQRTQPTTPLTSQQKSAAGLNDELEELLALPLGQSQGRYSRTKEQVVPVKEPEYPTLVRKVTIQDGFAELSAILADPNVPIRKAWMVFMKRFYGAKRIGTMKLIQEIEPQHRKVLHRLFSAVVFDWCADANNEALPKPTELIAKFQKLKIMDVDLWHNMQTTMISYLVKAQRLGPPPEDYKGDLMSELLLVWQEFFSLFSRVESSGNMGAESEGWKFLPEPVELKSMKQSKIYVDRFFHFASKIPRLKSRDSFLTTNALSTFALLINQDIRSDGTSAQHPDAGPFKTFVAQLVVGSELKSNPEPVKILLDVVLPREDSDFLSTLIFKSMGQALAIVAAIPDRGSPRHLEERFDDGPTDQGILISERYMKRLGRALEKQDAAWAQRLWHEAGQDFAALHMTAKLYRNFLRTFMALRKPDLAIDIWNDMISKGVEPDVAAWTAMMEGCREAKEAQAVESVWQKMLASAVKPDVGAWTARVHGLVSCRNWDMGLRAFEEMARVWLNAAKQSQGIRPRKTKTINTDFKSINDVGDAIKPTTATLNALVTGLARGQRHEAIARVLAWSRSHGIKENAATYNGLIIAAIRDSKADTVTQLLKQMDSAGIPPDIATFSIILDSFFRTSSVELSHDEQQDAISRFLTEMDKRGLKTNAYLYSKLIDRLFKHQNNDIAVRALLDHMRARSIAPEATIYTILITYYFNQQPPDFAAIDTLWHRIPDEQGSVDMMFYDRMIEGYARYGKIDKMMTFLTRMSKEGKPPGWWALSSVLRALDDTGNLGSIREIVRDVRREEGLFKDGCRGRTGKEQFWALVDDLGLRF